MSLAKEISYEKCNETEIAKACFEWVRDNIKHSSDYKLNPVTCIASDVLDKGTGYCYAKSHLLAALLRANDISAGLCYQRLSVYENGAPYCLHRLNAVYLKGWGWYRVDARGNKKGVNAQFIPPDEKLAFPIVDENESDFKEIWHSPLPVVVEALERYGTQHIAKGGRMEPLPLESIEAANLKRARLGLWSLDEHTAHLQKDFDEIQRNKGSNCGSSS